jgi:hypothetical protein
VGPHARVARGSVSLGARCAKILGDIAEMKVAQT